VLFEIFFEVLPFNPIHRHAEERRFVHNLEHTDNVRMLELELEAGFSFEAFADWLIFGKFFFEKFEGNPRMKLGVPSLIDNSLPAIADHLMELVLTNLSSF
jgi:hypothetical protein